MKAPKRISISLFDEELKGLINASAKIFPISQIDVDTNLNPNNYEYGKVDRSIYVWSNGTWEYVIADDVDIDWEEVKNKPTSYIPSEHGHSELHGHDNKSVLDVITSVLITSWNNAVTHILDAVKHITSDERTLWNTVSNKSNVAHNHLEINITDLDKYTKVEVDDKVNSKANIIHNHNDVYFTETEINTLLSGKSNSIHDHDGRYFTESEVNSLLGGKAEKIHIHTEANISDLDKYTKVEVDDKLALKSPTTHGHVDLHNHINKTILDKVVETTPQASYDLSELKYIEDIRAGYTEGHSHGNLTPLNSITQELIDGWNNKPNVDTNTITSINGKTGVIVKADIVALGIPTSDTNTTYTEITTAEIDLGTATTLRTITARRIKYILDMCAKLIHTHVKTDITDFAHEHDDSYYTESEIDTKLSSKVESSTFSGHTGNATVHVTQTDKNNWGGKQDVLGFTPVNTTDVRLSDARTPLTHNHTKSEITDFPTIPTTTNQLTNNSGFITLSDVPSGVDIGTIKPTDGSMWYQEI